MMKKVLISGIVLASSFLFAPLANAADLTVVNNTAAPSAVTVGGVCSGSVGQFTPAHASHTTPWAIVTGLCAGANPCVANIFANQNCSGAAIGTAKLDTSNGNISVSAPGHNIVAAPYSITINS